MVLRDLSDTILHCEVDVMNETIIKTIADELKISVRQVSTVLDMLENGDTVPFIARNCHR